jgi:hypothetical protein
MTSEPAPVPAFVRLRESGLRYDASGADLVQYEEAARLLIVLRGTVITAYSTTRPTDLPQVHHGTIWVTPLWDTVT